MPSLPPTFRPPWLQSRPREQQKREHDRRRGSSAARGYGSDWQALRQVILDAQPFCRFCERAGRLVKATVVDHEVPIAEAPERRLDPTNLQPLCKGCHDSTKQAADRRRRR